MSPIRIFVPGDSGAVSVGADRVAREILKQALVRDLDVVIVRNGSRGMYWLEPLVEVETPAGRIAYGPVRHVDVADLFDAEFLKGGEHALRLGPTNEISCLKNQQRLTFARVGVVNPRSVEDYCANGGFSGLLRALHLTPHEIVEEIVASTR